MLNTYINFWKRAFDFSGKSSRREFWWPYLINLCITLLYYLSKLPYFMAKFNYDFSTEYNGTTAGLMPPTENVFLHFFGIACVVFSLCALCPCLSITIRRLRDAGYQWPWIFIALFPIVGPIILLIFLAQPENLETSTKY